VGNLMLVALNVCAGIGWRALTASSALAFWAVAAVALPGARRLLHFGVPAAGELALGIAVVAVAVGLGAALSRLRFGGVAGRHA
jgi:Ca2+-transporting ATPase